MAPETIWVAMTVGTLITAGAVLIYKREVQPNVVVSWWEEAELTGSTGGVCRYRGKDTGIVKDVPLTDIQRALEDDAAACPPVLKLKICRYKTNPGGAPFITEITTP